MIKIQKRQTPRCEHRFASDFSVRQRGRKTFLKCNYCGTIADNPIKNKFYSKFPQAPAGWSRGKNPTTPTSAAVTPR